MPVNQFVIKQFKAQIYLYVNRQGLEKDKCIIIVATESIVVIEKVETIIYCK